jgi:hypothetical protein
MAYRLTALLLLPLISAAVPPEDYAEPYRILQEANLKLDAALAASAYASDGAIIFDYPGRPVETSRGFDAIRSSYVRTFGQVDRGMPIKLAFRFEQPGFTSDQQRGVYRIDATVGGRSVTQYGRFSVRLIKQGGAWRFAEDRGTAATAGEFDQLPPASLGAQ